MSHCCLPNCILRRNLRIFLASLFCSMFILTCWRYNSLLAVVFSKASSKTLDLGKVSYILASTSANAVVRNSFPILELKNKSRRNAPSLQIVSSDGKTYVRTVKKTLKKTLQSSGTLDQFPNRPAQVLVSAFYPEPIVTQSLPASHNAVIKTMSPSMRRSLKARRIRVRGGDSGMGGLMQRLKIGGYFAAWYALNVVYNIINKKILNVLPSPLIVGSIQFGIGALYCILVWILKFRDFPKLTSSGEKAVVSVGACHMLGQLSTMVGTKAFGLCARVLKRTITKHVSHYFCCSLRFSLVCVLTWL